MYGCHLCLCMFLHQYVGFTLNCSVICCPGSSPSSPTQTSESSERREGKTRGTTESPARFECSVENPPYKHTKTIFFQYPQFFVLLLKFFFSSQPFRNVLSHFYLFPCINQPSPPLSTCDPLTEQCRCRFTSIQLLSPYKWNCAFLLLLLQDAARKRKMEPLEQKQREQVGASFSLHFFIVVWVQTVHDSYVPAEG